MTRPMALARQLAETHDLPDGDLRYLLETQDEAALEYLQRAAAETSRVTFGSRI